jgi:hypothetical protein
LRLEVLEDRCVPTVLTGIPAPLVEVEPNDTLLQAQSLGDLTHQPQTAVLGTIGNGPAGAADVDWYQFTLDHASTVRLALLDRGSSSLVGVLSLYNSDAGDFSDQYDPLQSRLLVQDSGTATANAGLERLLAPGTYFVAVSGQGNLYFHPNLAGSGSPGSTGDYQLAVTGTDLGLSASDGPVVLTTDPAGGSTLSSSPFVIRADLSGCLDPSTVSGQTVCLLSNPTGNFGNGSDQAVPLAAVNYSGPAKELQLLPQRPLAPGSYEIVLAGNDSANQPVLRDRAGQALGQTAEDPNGQNFTDKFTIAARAGGTTADDTPATAVQVGDLSGAGLTQVAGAIGNDPAYDPTLPNPFLQNPTASVQPPYLFNPASGVDLYHFTISGPGRQAFVAEVFAGRIGSPLDSALTLFVRQPDGSLRLLAENDNTGNPSQAADGTLPLYTDSTLFAGLTAGDYYVAVSSSGNMPYPAAGILPGTNGVFDPLVSHSGYNGYTTGNYVLNLAAVPDAKAPTVVAATPGNGQTLSAPPTQIVVQFNEPVNLAQLAASQPTSGGGPPPVFVRGPDGVDRIPRLISYDNTTNQAVFLLLDALPNGLNELHLSAAGGLADLAGTPLTGNDPGGDYVVRFTVDGPPRGTGSDNQLWTAQGTQGPVHSQSLGALFPDELQAATPQGGVWFQRDFSTAPSGSSFVSADAYTFQILQNREYFFTQASTGTGGLLQMSLMTSGGTPVQLVPQGTGATVLATLAPGMYTLQVSGWTAGEQPDVSYQIQFTLGGSTEDPTPLTAGPAPAYRLVLAQNPPAPPVSAPTTGRGAVTPAPSSSVSAPSSSSGSSAAPLPGSQNALPAQAGDPPTPAVTDPPVLSGVPSDGVDPAVSAASPPTGTGAAVPAGASAPVVPPPVMVSTVVPTVMPAEPPAAEPAVRVVPPAEVSPLVLSAGGPSRAAPVLPNSQPGAPADLLQALRATPLGGLRGPSPADVPTGADRLLLPSTSTLLALPGARNNVPAATPGGGSEAGKGAAVPEPTAASVLPSLRRLGEALTEVGRQVSQDLWRRALGWFPWEGRGEASRSTVSPLPTMAGKMIHASLGTAEATPEYRPAPTEEQAEQVRLRPWASVWVCLALGASVIGLRGWKQNRKSRLRRPGATGTDRGTDPGQTVTILNSLGSRGSA